MDFGTKERRLLGAGGYYFTSNTAEEIRKDKEIQNGFDRKTITNTKDAESSDITKSYKKYML